MADDFNYDVFLSHSPKDKALVRALAERLRADGLRVCYFEWELKRGDNIVKKVEDALEHSRALVLCMSANAFGDNWAALEKQTLRFRDPLNKQRRFIPLRLDDAPIPASLAQFPPFSWHPDDREQGYAKLLEACRPPAQPSSEAVTAPERIAEKAIQLEFKGTIYAYAFSPDGKRALTAVGDNTVRLWDVESGRCLRVLEGHRAWVRSVAWSADNHRAISASDDYTLRLWDVKTGQCLRVLEGHTHEVLSVAWSTDQRRALSGPYDSPMRLWDVESGRCLGVLEGHTGEVWSVAWSADGRRALSGDGNGGIRVWNLSEFVAEARALEIPTPDQAQYTNAKVLLVGDTGVGKSGLAERLVHQQFVPTKSSHARKAHVLESNVVQEPSGVSLHQETVLWDLAGQPAYRLVHQLSMEDAALACVLFDCRNETNPFEGAAYWSQVLDQARTNTQVKSFWSPRASTWVACRPAGSGSKRSRARTASRSSSPPAHTAAKAAMIS